MTGASPTRVAVLAFEGVSLFQLSVPSLVFGVVNRPLNFPEYDVSYCGFTPGRVCSDQGILIDVPHDLSAMNRAEIIIIPA